MTDPLAPASTRGEERVRAKRISIDGFASISLGSNMIAYHLTSFGAYGFWLPNDPRGSWSSKVWADHLKPFGPATKVSSFESVAAIPHNQLLRAEAKRVLKYPAIVFNVEQREIIAQAINEILPTLRIRIFACAIMPDHVHLVTGAHVESGDTLIGYFKRSGTRQLNKTNRNPMKKFTEKNRTPSIWAENGWTVFIDSEDQLLACVNYVEQNPIKAGLPPQRWSFVEMAL